MGPQLQSGSLKKGVIFRSLLSSLTALTRVKHHGCFPLVLDYPGQLHRTEQCPSWWIGTVPNSVNIRIPLYLCLKPHFSHDEHPPATVRGYKTITMPGNPGMRALARISGIPWESGSSARFFSRRQRHLRRAVSKWASLPICSTAQSNLRSYSPSSWVPRCVIPLGP
eukprot:s3513_g2.t1